MAPVLSLIIEALIEHVHDFVEFVRAIEDNVRAISLGDEQLIKPTSRMSWQQSRTYRCLSGPRDRYWWLQKKIISIARTMGVHVHEINPGTRVGGGSKIRRCHFNHDIQGIRVVMAVVIRDYYHLEKRVAKEVRPHIPFRTLTCTEEYPFVTFLTLRTTLDMMAVSTRRSQQLAKGRGGSREMKVDRLNDGGLWGGLSCQALTARSHGDSGPKRSGRAMVQDNPREAP